jgi:hypothetical protein
MKTRRKPPVDGAELARFWVGDRWRYGFVKRMARGSGWWVYFRSMRENRNGRYVFTWRRRRVDSIVLDGGAE